MKSRSFMLAGILVIAFLLGSFLLYRTLFEPAEATPAILVTVDGDVRVVSPGGASTQATAGTRVEQGASIRTRRDARSVLRVNGSSTVSIDSQSDVIVEAVAPEQARFLVNRGRLEADVPEGDGQAVEVGARNTGARVRTEGGRVAVAADGYGSMSVVSSAGQSVVSSGDREVTLGAGEQVVVSGEEISDVMEIPTSILLKVAWPTVPEGATRHSELEVAGRADPGSILDVNGQAVRVSADGTWTAIVPLEEGSNELKVEARDAAGHEASDEATVERDTRGPPLQAGQGVWK